MINVLVTGVGGPLGQALIKALRQSSLECRIFGCDRFDLSVGLHWVERGYVLADCGRTEEYIAGVRRVCEAEEVQAVLPGSDRELEILAGHAPALKKDTGAV